MSINPLPMEQRDWFDSTCLLLSGETPIQRLDNLDDWQDWAANLMATPNLIGQNVPDPYSFDDWREWAMRFNETAILEATT